MFNLQTVNDMEGFDSTKGGFNGTILPKGSGGTGRDGHSPYIGDNGNWFEWDDATQQYIDTGIQAQGEDGEPGAPGVKLSGFVFLSSTSDLPSTPTTEQQTIGYIIGTKLYVYVGTGGDTLDDKYKDCGEFRGPQGSPAEVVNDLTTGGAGKALSAEQGKIINEKVLLDVVNIPFSISGKYISNTGVETSWFNGTCTDFYPCNGGDVFKFIASGNQARVIGYDANKEFVSILSSASSTEKSIEIINASIAYVRCSAHNDDTTKSFSKSNKQSLGTLRRDIDVDKTSIDTLQTSFNDKVKDTELLQIPLDVNDSYIKSDGTFAYSADYKRSSYIPVKEGEKCNYSGVSGSSMSVAGYNYDKTTDTYTFVRVVLKSYLNTSVDKKFYIPSGITHIVAAGGKSKLPVVIITKQSELSSIKDGLGEFFKNIVLSGFSTGYIGTDGNLHTSTGQYKLINVNVGDIIEVYDNDVSATNTLIAKQLTETTFKPLVVVEQAETFVTYTVTEKCTMAVASAYGFRQAVHRINKPTTWDAYGDAIAGVKSDLANEIDALDIQDLHLGYMFNKIAVIGDSMSVGTLEGGLTGNFGSSWLSMLAKIWNCEKRYHYANGGTSTYQWLNDNSTYGLGRLLADNVVYNAYFIAYGHNDTMDAGTAEDAAAPVTITEGVPSSPSGYSFCAYYKAIINQIRAKAAHAIIFCLSEYDDVIKGKTAYRQGIIDVAEQYYEGGDKLVLHLETGGVPVSGMGLGGHYSTQGYIYIAQQVNKEANKVIYEHRTDEDMKLFGSYNQDDVR